MSKSGTQRGSKPGLVTLALVHKEVEKFFSRCALLLELVTNMFWHVEGSRTLWHTHSSELIERSRLRLLVHEVGLFDDLSQVLGPCEFAYCLCERQNKSPVRQSRTIS